MSTLQEETVTVHRGVALHKMIRLFTNALGGEVNMSDLKTNNFNLRDI